MYLDVLIQCKNYINTPSCFHKKSLSADVAMKFLKENSIFAVI